MLQKIKKALVGLVIVGVVGAIFSAGWFLSSLKVERDRSASVATASKIAQNIDDNKIAEAYSFADQDFKTVVNENDFAQSVAILTGDGAKIDFINEVYSGYDSHLVSFAVADKNDKPIGTLSMFMIKEDGEWRYRDLNIVN